ncbi:hypothetical protein PGTUg99_000241 [Puccinia graminis f. sp. tritici]|uniref:Uncharacterized protein n=1 Tax=Puccinia graminis f. sp. tritici TaxID=56615 RepID=A0A5B0S8X5_PUCGR|nr:hypothetical protein PGTUg99_000241 [Puccinia graminis f. sp. tritici]
MEKPLTLRSADQDPINKDQNQPSNLLNESIASSGKVPPLPKTPHEDSSVLNRRRKSGRRPKSTMSLEFGCGQNAAETGGRVASSKIPGPSPPLENHRVPRFAAASARAAMRSAQVCGQLLLQVEHLILLIRYKLNNHNGFSTEPIGPFTQGA